MQGALCSRGTWRWWFCRWWFQLSRFHIGELVLFEKSIAPIYCTYMQSCTELIPTEFHGTYSWVSGYRIIFLVYTGSLKYRQLSHKHNGTGLGRANCFKVHMFQLLYRPLNGISMSVGDIDVGYQIFCCCLSMNFPPLHVSKLKPLNLYITQILTFEPCRVMVPYALDLHQKILFIFYVHP